MKKLIILSLLVVSSQAFSNVISKADTKNKCTKYSVISDEAGRKTPLAKGEKLVVAKQVYGLALKNMNIDFDNRVAKFDLIANVVLGFNTKLTNGQVVLSERQNEFREISNQVNQKLSLFSEVCLSSTNEIVYATFRDNK